ncbi:F0F1 ATP synthase subunit B family protein [Edaphobacter albus]|uniref:F0F1 ATP synthase subunit B family protein n=1 Tax=Edaphobacter sp. 4G125 TaxID=2763071 RepID=UPI0016483484|nr:ATP synthase F0 subunit B [Edaphobacter sp. 4G125]QNI36011.1 ATP synthase F0 subunit B [Edaphobacter sp. 4G125]
MTCKALLPAIVLGMLLAGPAPRVFAQESTPVAAQSAHEGSQSAEAEKHEKEEDENDAYRHSAAVKALGAKLGLDAEQAADAFTLLNFIILAALIGWFMLKTLPKVFRDRSSALEKHLVEARRVSEEASSRLSGVEARLKNLDEQIATMRTQAEKDAQAEEKRMKSSVEEEKQKILASAEQEISAAAAQARRQLQQYAADLAVDQAAKKLVVSAETDRLLVQEFARRLGGEGGQN